MSAQETQPERTLLSWQRTGLGLLAVAGLLGSRAVLTGRTAPLLLAGSVALLGLTVLGGVAPWRARALERAPASAPVPVALATAAVVTAALAAAAALLSR